MGDRRYVLTLVHGTFAKNKIWVQPESYLSRRLDELLGGVEIRQFDWTGNNSHEARLQAGRDLGTFLDEGFLEFPSAIHFIIAHSHGGNVALYSLSDDFVTSQRSIAGVVTLGTPFITVRPRNLDGAFSILIYAIPALASLPVLFMAQFLTAFLGGIVAGALMRFGVQLSPLHIIPWTTPIVALSVLLTWRQIRRTLATRIFPWARSSQQAIIGRLAHRPPSELRVLALLERNDEAGLLLRNIRRLAGWPYLIWHVWLFVGLFILLALFLGVVMVQVPFISENSPRWWWLNRLPPIIPALLFSTAFAAVFVFILAVLLQFVMAALPRAVRAHWMAFGGETVTDNWFVDIRSALIPEGISNVKFRTYSLTLPILRRLRTFQLRHSMLYNDDAALHEIASWIQEIGARAEVHAK